MKCLLDHLKKSLKSGAKINSTMKASTKTESKKLVGDEITEARLWCNTKTPISFPLKRSQNRLKMY